MTRWFYFTNLFKLVLVRSIKVIKLFYGLFNHDKIDDLNRNIDIYKERNEQLEAELREYKGYKLKYEVTKLYVEDDDALLELFDVAKKHDLENARRQAEGVRGQEVLWQQQLGQSGVGALGGLFGRGY